MIKNIFLVGLGGAMGSILRFLLQRLINTPIFPFGTLLINIGGCFLIGLLWGVIQKGFATETIKFLLMTGFCGGFTTFSAFSFESMQMAQNQKWLLLFLYITSSVAGGLLATFGGYKITN